MKELSKGRGHMKTTNPLSILQEIFFSTEICFQENPARKNKIGIGENYMEKCLGAVVAAHCDIKQTCALFHPGHLAVPEEGRLGVSKQLLLLLADLHHGAGPGECFAEELLSSSAHCCAIFLCHLGYEI